MLDKAVQYYHTVRYLRPWQVVGRLVAITRRRLPGFGLPEPPAGLHGGLQPFRQFLRHDPWNSREDILAGTFRFLDVRRKLGRPVDWQAEGMPLLWKYNLHYFKYLPLLAHDEQVTLCREWIKANPPGRTTGWQPYPTSQRIVNWCKAGFKDSALLESLYLQAAYLYRNLETYVLGNHYLENARALVFAGVNFGGQGEAAAWLEKGRQIIRSETPEQILADGGSFERSPMYHALALEAYLDLLNLLPVGDTIRPVLVDAVRRMGDFLASLTHPNGKIALFNDTTQEIAPGTLLLLSYLHDLTGYRAEKHSVFPHSGYFVHEDGMVFLAIDGGELGPNYLPGHAHADIFSFELSLGAKPFVVDSGVFEYQAGEMRSYVRGTRAHNTVCVDRSDQAECWGSFRVARRFAPFAVSFRANNGKILFEGSFDGYAHLLGDGIIHHRRIEIDPERRELRVHDSVEGTGRHLVESLLHLHPTVQVTQEGSRTVLRQDNYTATLQRCGDVPLSVETGWYCPRFGVRHENSVLVLGGPAALPVSLSYVILY